MTLEASGALENALNLLRCPASGLTLARSGSVLVSADGHHRYPITDEGIAILGGEKISADARIQQSHYDKVSQEYLTNLGYPHTQEYMSYLDTALLDTIASQDLGDVAEICCGRGEAFELIGGRVARGVGVDISLQMLRAARNSHAAGNLCFVQGDATRLPLGDNAFDNVFMLGGIHHVRDRQRLFREVARILKPGGRFYFREPVSDFLPWRLIRAVVYRFSASLDYETEQPLQKRETLPPLTAAGLALVHWRTHGFFGFCIFMNSDILVFNRLFRFVPGIRALTRWSTRVDEWTLKVPGLADAGLQVVGVATKRAPSQ